MNISIKANEKFYKDLKEIGFYGIDFPFGAFSDREKLLSKEFEDSIAEKSEKIKSYGLKVCQTHLTYYPGHLEPIGDGTYKAFEEYMLPIFEKQLELTKKLGCDTAVIHLYFEKDREKSRAGNIELLKKLLIVAEKNGVALAIENIYGPNYSDAHLSTKDDLLYYINYFKNPHLGICLDTGHAVIRGENPVFLLKSLYKHIVALHIHTTVPNMDLHAVPYCVSYGEQIDWEEFVNILKDNGYKKSFNLEIVCPSRFNDKAFLNFYRFAYEAVKSIIG